MRGRPGVPPRFYGGQSSEEDYSGHHGGPLGFLHALTHWQQRVLVAGVLALAFIVLLVLIRGGGGGGPPGPPRPPPLPFPRCTGNPPCPETWNSVGGGFYCQSTGGCRPGAQGSFPSCPVQCIIGNPPTPAGGFSGHAGGTAFRPNSGAALKPQQLTAPGHYDLRVIKGSKLLGCAAPIGLFPGQEKYGCAGQFSTAQTCDAAQHPIKDTEYVKAVHAGCETDLGRGTYGYAYDDGVGLKQCSPLAKYEWVLCPTGQEGPIMWEAGPGKGQDSTQRFRVTNRCSQPVWIEQAGPADGGLPDEEHITRLDPDSSYTYSIPNRGLASTRFLPKTGCDEMGNYCDIQSMPPCPEGGCDLPVDTKFESSWGCVYSTGVLENDKAACTLTGQGNPSTYQDWWDGSAVDGWTLPFSILVDDGGHGLTPGSQGSPDICGPVVCANLDAARMCPTDEFLTPVA